MKNYTIDNSADSDLNRAITWQFDNAVRLCETIGMFKDFFNQSTKAMWDSVTAKLKIADVMNPDGTTIKSPETCDDYGLSIWGKLLGVPRPEIRTDASDPSTAVEMSKELYRKILIARFRLANSNASVDAYNKFVTFIFGNKVTMTDNKDMSISFSWNGSATTAEELEMKRAIEQVPDAIFAYPAGVKSSVENDGPVFGFYEQVRNANGQPLSSNVVINNQSVQTATYTYTKNGRTYTRQHKDFKIANLDHGTIAWNRFAR